MMIKLLDVIMIHVNFLIMLRFVVNIEIYKKSYVQVKVCMKITGVKVKMNDVR